jgi:hypothetical protein
MLKTERLTIKVTFGQKGVLEQLAQADSESVAAVIRRLIREEAERKSLTQPTDAQQKEASR